MNARQLVQVVLVALSGIAIFCLPGFLLGWSMRGCADGSISDNEYRRLGSEYVELRCLREGGTWVGAGERNLCVWYPVDGGDK
mgnify:CR=1 FL=1